MIWKEEYKIGVPLIDEQHEEQNEINGCKEIVMQQFAGRIVTWLVNHVVGEDQKVAEFAKTR